MEADPGNSQDLTLSFGQRLRRIREEKGLSQSELARQCGLTPAAVSQLEAEDRQPSFGTLRRIAEGLGVTAAHLLGESADVPDHLEAFFRDLEKLSAPDREKVKAFAAFLRSYQGKPKS